MVGLRNPDAAINAARVAYDAAVMAGASEVEAVAGLQDRYARALMLVDQLFGALRERRLHIWHQHFVEDEAWIHATGAVGHAFAGPFPELARLVVDIAQRAVVNQIGVMDGASLLFDVLATELPAERGPTALYRQIAATWSDDLDPLSTQDCRILPPLLASPTGTWAIATSPADVGCIWFDPHTDDELVLFRRIAAAGWAASRLSVDAVVELYNATRRPDFFRLVAEWVPYAGASNDVEINALVASFEAFRRAQADPFVTASGALHPLSLVHPHDTTARTVLATYETIDVSGRTDPAAAWAYVRSQIRLTGGGVLVVAPGLLDDPTFAEQLRVVVLSGGPVVFLGKSTPALAAFVAETGHSLHTVQPSESEGLFCGGSPR